MPKLNETHDPQRRSWHAAANDAGTDFPIQNLPFGVFRRRGSDEVPRGGVAIGDAILDLASVHRAKLFEGKAAEAVAAASDTTLNRLMGLGAAHWSALRLAVSRLLAAGGADEAERRRLGQPCLVWMQDAELLLGAAVGDYTDFYASIFHATNVGKQLRPDNPLLPNYKWIPIGYHGRGSSLVVSGTKIRRPSGQLKLPDQDAPMVAPCRMLDYELEMGFFVGPGNGLGTTLTLDEAADRIFGFCLLNDWSARDIQAWEYAPLGPFLAKSLGTTLSPWIVTAEALAPFRAPSATRPAGDPQPLPYLTSARDAAEGGLDVILEAYLRTAQMQAENAAPHRLSRGNAQTVYWTVAQMLTHHASNGCNLNPGDLLGTGTISGPDKESWGSLIELTFRGRERIELPTGETRGFIEDGDEILFRARCERPGHVAIGFGECRGIVTPTA
ncbi:MAG: fumarylacetoacetase [Rhodospirillales bacterium]|nr:fumarylacetoacetase [Rhodospirillales bacterium]